VLVDEHRHILSTGYNGVAAGLPHCNEKSQISKVSLDIDWVYPHACPGAHYKSSEGLDECYAIHAEQNALLQCPDVLKIHTAYCTTFPCIHCVKLLLNTSCQIIVYDEHYSNEAGLVMLLNMGRKVYHIGELE